MSDPPEPKALSDLLAKLLPEVLAEQQISIGPKNISIYVVNESSVPYLEHGKEELVELRSTSEAQQLGSTSAPQQVVVYLENVGIKEEKIDAVIRLRVVNGKVEPPISEVESISFDTFSPEKEQVSTTAMMKSTQPVLQVISQIVATLLNAVIRQGV